MRENNFRVNPRSLKTSISKVEKDKIITRGYNQRDLIEKIRYSDMIYLLLLIVMNLNFQVYYQIY